MSLKRNIYLLLFLISALPSAAALAQDDKATKSDKPAEAKKIEADSLIGDWSINAGTRQGNPIGSERLPANLTFTKDSITLPTGADDFQFAYKLDLKAVPVAIDLEITGGPVPEGRAVGIVKFDGADLVLCYDPTGQNRPKEFKSTEENGCFLFTLKRKAGGFDAKQMVGTWNYTGGNKSGEELTAERLPGDVVITEKDFTLPAGPTDKFVMSYKLDETKSPVTIDLKIESGPVPEAKALGIIKVDGDNLVLCYDSTGQKRPEKFEANEDNGFFLFKLKLKK